jgi:hypothetical protein
MAAKNANAKKLTAKNANAKVKAMAKGKATSKGKVTAKKATAKKATAKKATAKKTTAKKTTAKKTTAKKTTAKKTTAKKATIKGKAKRRHGKNSSNNDENLTSLMDKGKSNNIFMEYVNVLMGMQDLHCKLEQCMNKVEYLMNQTQTDPNKNTKSMMKEFESAYVIRTMLPGRKIYYQETLDNLIHKKWQVCASQTTTRGKNSFQHIVDRGRNNVLFMEYVKILIQMQNIHCKLEHLLVKRQELYNSQTVEGMKTLMEQYEIAYSNIYVLPGRKMYYEETSMKLNNNNWKSCELQPLISPTRLAQTPPEEKKKGIFSKIVDHINANLRS